MLKKYFLLLLIFSISLIFVSGCASSEVAIQDPVVGIIKVVGNDPFTNLAIEINNKVSYILECTEDVKKELLKNQGKVFEIKYNSVKNNEQGVVLVVEKAIPLNTK